MSDFDEIYATHVRAVFHYAVKCVGRRDIAEEITSDTFLELHRRMAQVDLHQLPGWLFAVVRNKAIDHWRRAQLERRYLESLPDTQAASHPSIELWLGSATALKPVHRACLILRYVHGMTRSEIAGRLGLSEIQVKGHLQYALTILRRELEKAIS